MVFCLSTLYSAIAPAESGAWAVETLAKGPGDLVPVVNRRVRADWPLAAVAHVAVVR